MKQRTRIRRIKARTYPNHIYLARQRRQWAEACAKWRKLRGAMIEAYAAGRKAYEMSEMREEQQEPSAERMIFLKILLRRDLLEEHK